MKKVYSASNLQEAHIVLHLLEDAGIESHIFNENAQGGVGELPFTHAYPEIWLEHEDDEDKARIIIKKYESSSVSSGVIECAHCKEENPDNFTVCWSCGEALDSTGREN